MNAVTSPALSTAPRGIALYDAHNHLQDEWLKPYAEKVIRQVEELPIRGAVVNGTWDGDWNDVAALAGAHTWVYPSFGVHPWLAGKRSANWLSELEGFLRRFPQAGVGEIGLDRWILDRARPDDPRLEGLPRASIEEQGEVFTTQLSLAANLNRAATIHCLDAWGLLWEIVRAASLPARGFLLHAYGGSAEMLSGFLDRGAYFSFNGYFLGERKERQREVFKRIPLDRLLVETDAPSMPLPQAWRTHKLPPGPGNTPLNHPANIEAVYTGLASLRGTTVAELATAVETNFLRFFGNR